MQIELYPHQVKALGEIKNGCILGGEPGSGKSIVSLAYFFTRVCGGSLTINGRGDTLPMDNAMDLYIITTVKKRDKLEWEDEAMRFAISRDPNISFGGIKMTVDSWNNILKYKDVKNAFFIFDEQRLVGSGAWVKAFLSIAKSNQWIILSATPGDKWIDYIPVFIANGFYRNRTEFISRHVIYSPHVKNFPKIDGYQDTGRLLKLRRSILVPMPFVRHTKPINRSLIASYDQELFEKVFKQRWNPYAEEPIQNVSQLFQLMRRVVNSDESRLHLLHELWEKHRKLIVFYNFDYELIQMREFLSQKGLVFSEWNGHKHQEIPDTDSWLYLVQYAGAEAWNCITTDTVVFYSLHYSYRQTEQARGRIDRLNTPFTDLYYYFIRSVSWIDQQIWKSLVTKEEFNEKKASLSLL